MCRIEIIKSTLPTSWYNGRFIGRQFNVKEIFKSCVELEHHGGMTKGVTYYVMTGDYKKVGEARGRKKAWQYGRETEDNRFVGYPIRRGKKKTPIIEYSYGQSRELPLDTAEHSFI